MTGRRRRCHDGGIIDQIGDEAGWSKHIRVFLRRGLALSVGVLFVYITQTQVMQILSTADRLRDISIGWFAVMALCEALSFVCMWALIRQMLPDTPWFVVATSHMVANSVSRVVPGGAAVGGATLYRMLAVSGVQPNQAASAMAASGVVSNALLFAIPTVAGVLALLGAPIPKRLLPAAIAGGVFFFVLMALGVVAIRFTRPLLVVGRTLDRLVLLAGRPIRRNWSVEPGHLVEERDRLVGVLEYRWPKAVVAAASNWAFDYLALIAALYAVGAEPRLSVVLLAYAAASVLAMVPFTPGGIGFVEVGLYWTLIISGISARDAGLATIGYRLISWWLPVVAGLGAWVAFKARFGQWAVNREDDSPDGVGPPDDPGRTPGGAGTDCEVIDIDGLEREAALSRGGPHRCHPG
ncbi:MAG: YbhN family protein [Acidimicrobiales bacterium]